MVKAGYKMPDKYDFEIFMTIPSLPKQHKIASILTSVDQTLTQPRKIRPCWSNTKPW
jgi:hypothetical protein